MTRWSSPHRVGHGPFSVIGFIDNITSLNKIKLTL
jgi:hypothetical protein